MQWITIVKDTIVGLTGIGIVLLALSIVLQVLFGSGAPFLPGDVIKNLTDLIASLGDKGLVGLIALGAVVCILKRA